LEAARRVQPASYHRSARRGPSAQSTSGTLRRMTSPSRACGRPRSRATLPRSPALRAPR